MRALGLLVIVGLAAVVFLYVRQTGGAPSDGGGLSGLLNIFKGVGEGAAANAKPWWDELYAQPWFWTAAVSITGAGIGIKFWRSLGGFGKGCVIVALAVAATVLVVKFG
jgi:hypothetical protein